MSTSTVIPFEFHVETYAIIILLLQVLSRFPELLVRDNICFTTPCAPQWTVLESDVPRPAILDLWMTFASKGSLEFEKSISDVGCETR